MISFLNWLRTNAVEVIEPSFVHFFHLHDFDLHFRFIHGEKMVVFINKYDFLGG